MKLSQADPSCPCCIVESTVELTAETPVKIKVTVVLAPPPQDETFPGGGETVNTAELEYKDSASNKATRTIAVDSSWTSGTTHTDQFSAPSWLTPSDFENLSATLTIKTNQRTVVQHWSGIEGG